jgi:hypothetical protein
MVRPVGSRYALPVTDPAQEQSRDPDPAHLMPPTSSASIEGAFTDAGLAETAGTDDAGTEAAPVEPVRVESAPVDTASTSANLPRASTGDSPDELVDPPPTGGSPGRGSAGQQELLVPMAEASVISTTGTAAAAADARPRASRRLLPAIIFAIIGIVAALGATGLYLYNRVAEPDRSTPAVVSRQFLEAILIDQRSERVSLFACKSWPPDVALAQVLPTFDPSVRASWGVIDVVENDDAHATVAIRVTFSAAGASQAQRDVQVWHLTLVKEDGWRVCGVTKDESFSP